MERIIQALSEIELKKKIRILYACETGSRAWGFPSPDSDYDVRFIYMHERDWYLSLSDRKDTVEFMNDELDVTGWDLRKCLILLKKSNAPLLERFSSPVVYREDPEFREAFTRLIHEYYSPTAVFYHHLSLARKIRDELEGRQEIKLKSYFYLIRSLLSCNWIIRNPAMVPMNIRRLMEYITPEQRNALHELIKLKSEVNEKYQYRRTVEVDMWIRGWFGFVETSANRLGVNRQDMKALNSFFIKTVNEYADH